MPKRMKDHNITAFEWCHRLCDIYIALLLSVFILFCSPYEGIVETKHLCFLILCGGFICAMTVSILELLLIRQLDGSCLWSAIQEKKTVFLLGLSYLLLTFVSGVLSPYDYNYWVGMSRYEGFVTQAIYVLSFLFIVLFGRLGQAHILLFGITMTVFSGICILQLSGLNPFYLYPVGYHYYDANIAYSGEYLGTVGNADLVAALLSMAILLFFAYFLIETGKRRYACLIPLLLCAGVLVKARVAAGLVAVFASVLIILPVCVKQKGRKRWKAVLAVELCALLGALAVLYAYDFGGSGTLYEFHEVLHGNIGESFGSSRIKIWKEVLAEMPEHLLLGTGPDSMMAWELEGFSKVIADSGLTVERGIDVAHNEYLNVAAQQGILTFIPYILILFYSFYDYFKHQNGKKSMVVLAAVMAYAVQAFFSFSMCLVTPVYLTFLGLAFCKNGAFANEKFV